MLHCTIFSATCLAMELRDKFPDNIRCLAVFLVRELLHEVELSSIFCNGLQQLHSASPLQQLFSQFYGSFNECACSYGYERLSLTLPKILQGAEIALWCYTEPRQLATLHFQVLRDKLLRTRLPDISNERNVSFFHLVVFEFICSICS